MAIATSSNFYSNAIVGQPQAGADIDVYSRHTTPQFSIGFGFIRGDGNRFRYVHYGAAVAAGAVVGANATNNNVASVNAIVVATATADAVANETIKPGDVGSRYVEITLATVANNQFAGGYLSITKDTGVGYTYRIKGNTATGTPKSTTFRMELYDKIKVKLDNTSDIAIAPSIYVDLDEVPAIPTGYNIAGITMVAASADNWGWVCTRGPVGVLSSDTAIYGSRVYLTNGTAAGAVRALPVDAAYLTGANLVGMLTNSPQIGYVLVPAGAAGQQAIIYATIE